MKTLGLIAVASAVVPLLVAWWNTRGSTIRHALAWAFLAWLAWLWTAANSTELSRLAALALTGAAGVAVLGARRPGVIAWHFVVATLLVVLGLAWAEAWLTGGELHLHGPRQWFLACLTGVTLVNYLPTRYWCGALLIGNACFITLFRRSGVIPNDVAAFIALLMAGMAPWMALGSSLAPRSRSPFNVEWRRFRDTFGAVWAQRLREQFNAAARHASWNEQLKWSGLSPSGTATDDQLAALRSLMKRFRTSD